MVVKYLLSMTDWKEVLDIDRTFHTKIYVNLAMKNYAFYEFQLEIDFIGV